MNAVDIKPLTTTIVAEQDADIASREALLDAAMGPKRRKKASEKLRRGRKPSEGLAPRLVQQMESIMTRVRAHGHAVLLVEQNFALAMAVADHVHVVASGWFVFDGTPRELTAATAVLDQHLGVAGKGDS